MVVVELSFAGGNIIIQIHRSDFSFTSAWDRIGGEGDTTEVVKHIVQTTRPTECIGSDCFGLHQESHADLLTV